MFFRSIFVSLVIYLIYRGIMFVFRMFAAINSGNNNRTAPNNDTASSSPKSKFKDVEEAHYTEIKDDRKQDPN